MLQIQRGGQIGGNHCIEIPNFYSISYIFIMIVPLKLSDLKTTLSRIIKISKIINFTNNYT